MTTVPARVCRDVAQALCDRMHPADWERSQSVRDALDCANEAVTKSCFAHGLPHRILAAVVASEGQTWTAPNEVARWRCGLSLILIDTLEGVRG